MTTKYDLNREVHDELVGVVEDSISFACDEYSISSELAWTVIQTLAAAKLAQINGLLNR